MLFGFALINKLKVGYFNGDPHRLIEDCQILKPAVFPSVPRLFNRIFATVKMELEKASGMQKMLIDWAVDRK